MDGLTVLVDQFVDALHRAVFPPGTAGQDFNRDVFVGKEQPLARVLDAANTLPAFAPRRLVLVRRANQLLEGQVSESDAKAFLAYVASPSPSTTLLLIAGSKWDGRAKLVKALNKAGALIRFESPSERDMPKTLRAYAKAAQIRVESDAVRALVTALGHDFQRALEMLHYLHLYVGPESGRSIHPEDVAKVVSAVPEESVFELIDSLEDEAPERVLRGLYRLLVVKREPPLRLLALMARHYRQLLTVSVAQKGASLASLLGVPPFVADRLATQAAKGSTVQFARALASISMADRALKGGQLEAVRAMERLVLHLRSDQPLGGPRRG
ncbi:MAG: DNA polymerase III subunit delta [Myxococcales bacterium]|nr:DNA polymerase III subunit delta [Myxococcales bacterium]